MLTRFTPPEHIPVFRALLKIKIEIEIKIENADSVHSAGTHPRFWGSTRDRDRDWDQDQKCLLGSLRWNTSLFLGLYSRLRLRLRSRSPGRGMIRTSPRTRHAPHQSHEKGTEYEKSHEKGTEYIWVKRTRMDIMQKSVTYFSTLELKYTNLITGLIKCKNIRCTILSIRVII